MQKSWLISVNKNNIYQNWLLAYLNMYSEDIWHLFSYNYNFCSKTTLDAEPDNHYTESTMTGCGYSPVKLVPIGNRIDD